MLVHSLLFVVAAAAPAVSGGAAVTVGGAKGHKLAAGQDVVIEAQGPTTLLLEVFASSDAANLVLVRNGSSRAEADVEVKPAPKSPLKTHKFKGSVALALPAGAQRIVVTGTADLVVLPSVVSKVGRAVAMLAEGPLAPSAVPAAAASVEPAGPTSPQAAAEALGGGEIASKPAATHRALLTRVAVYDFELAAIDPAIGTVVTDSMLAEVRKLTGISAIGMNEIRDMLSHEASKQLVGCSDEACLAEIAGALGVDELVSGKLAKVDDGVVFVARRVDEKRAKVVGVVNQRLKAGSGEEFLAAIGPAVEQLFPYFQLKDGQSRGVPEEMALRLNPPPLPAWSFYSVAGLSAAAAVAGGVFGMLALGAEARYQDMLKADRVEGSLLMPIAREAERDQKYCNFSLAGAGVMALSAGIMALFTDFYGYGDAQLGR